MSDVIPRLDLQIIRRPGSQYNFIVSETCDELILAVTQLEIGRGVDRRDQRIGNGSCGLLVRIRHVRSVDTIGQIGQDRLTALVAEKVFPQPPAPLAAGSCDRY